MKTKCKLSLVIPVTIVLCLAVNARCSDKIPSSNSIVVVKSPRTMKRLVMQPQETNTPHRVIEKSLRCAAHFIVDSQNPDGSWGAANQCPLATPLAMLGWMGAGLEDDLGKASGLVIARDWLLKSNPTNCMEIVFTIIALAEYDITMENNSELVQTSKATQKIATLLKELPLKKEGVCADFVVFFHPFYIPRYPNSFWAERTLEEKYSQMHIAAALTTPQDYLSAYLIASARFRLGRHTWRELEHSDVRIFINSQMPDGSFPAAEGQDRVSTTAFATMLLAIYSKIDFQKWD